MSAAAGVSQCVYIYCGRWCSVSQWLSVWLAAAARHISGRSCPAGRRGRRTATGGDVMWQYIGLDMENTVCLTGRRRLGLISGLYGGPDAGGSIPAVGLRCHRRPSHRGRVTTRKPVFDTKAGFLSSR